MNQEFPPYPAAPPAPPTAQPMESPYPMRMPKVDGLAVAALVLGIVWIYWIGSILAIIFGAIAIKRIDASNGWITGRGMAKAGLVLGIVGVSIFMLFFIIGFAAGVSGS